MDITNIDFTTITGNECDFNNVNCGNLGATGPSNLNSITGTSLTINNDTVLNNLRLQTLNVNNSLTRAVVHDPTTTQLFHKDDFVDTTQTQTLLNKTLTTPIIESVISNGNVVTFPTVTADLIGRATIDRVSNKSFYDEFNDIIQFSDETIKLKFRCGGMTNTTTRIVGSQLTNIDVTLPSTAGQIALISDIPSPATYITLNDVQMLTNKTIDTAAPNSLLVNGTNITTLINQDVRTTAAPTFAGLTTTVGGTFRGTRPISPTSAGVYIGENGPGDYALEIVAAAGSNNSYIDFGLPNVDNSGRILYAHSTGNLNLSAVNFVTAGPNCILSGVVRIATLPSDGATLTGVLVRDNINAGNIRIRNDFVDLATGQTLSNKTLTQPIISQILNGTGTLTLPINTNATLATTNDLIGVVTQTGTATLINKTINTNGPNSILVNNVLITNLLNQDVRTTAAPLFTGLNLNNRSQVFTWSQVTSTNLSTDVLTVPVPNNSAITIETMMTFYCTTGTNINKAGTRKRTNRVINIGGGLSTSANIENLSSNDGGLNSISIQYVASGVNSIVQIIGQLGDTITCTGVTTVYYI
jgi:hypothetical protein